MKLSTKGRYAVMAMVDIGQNGEGRTVSLAEIAGRQDISQEYLEQLFVKLRKAGLVGAPGARAAATGWRAMPMKSSFTTSSPRSTSR